MKQVGWYAFLGWDEMLCFVACSISVPQSATELWQASRNLRVGVDLLFFKTKQLPRKHLCRVFVVLQHQQGNLFTEFFEKQCALSAWITCQETNKKGKKVVCAYAAFFGSFLIVSVLLLLLFVSSFKVGWTRSVSKDTFVLSFHFKT